MRALRGLAAGAIATLILFPQAREALLHAAGIVLALGAGVALTAIVLSIAGLRR